ncbi:MAG: Ig-like domain-containing protein, partial [Acidobacteria bacterium]|nr:Ig-like domain-containing protein [Acidobacteriota bacterium]MBI3490175.1 Ig-like domain-containing protein [Acidobacteriota bacterium]
MEVPMRRWFPFTLGLIGLLGLMLCGGGSGGSSDEDKKPKPVSVAISPASVSVLVNGTQAFTATVTGSSNTAVTWKVSETGGGAVSASGLYAAPATAGTY